MESRVLLAEAGQGKASQPPPRHTQPLPKTGAGSRDSDAPPPVRPLARPLVISNTRAYRTIPLPTFRILLTFNMLQIAQSSSSRAVARLATAPLRTAGQRRLASGGGSNYNQPSGFLFGEKVSIRDLGAVRDGHDSLALGPILTLSPRCLCMMPCSAPPQGPEAREGGLGEHLVLGNGRWIGIHDHRLPLQARHQVSGQGPPGHCCQGPSWEYLT